MKKLALFDIDDTLYKGPTLYFLTEYFSKKGILNKNFTDLLVNDFKLYKSGSIGYEATVINLIDHLAEGLKGIKYDYVLDETTKFLQSEGNRFYDFVGPLFNILKDTHDIYLVTGEPQFIAEAVKTQFHTNGFLATQLVVEDGLFGGTVKSHLATGKEKKTAISELISRYDLFRSIAFGDSISDVEMLDSVEIQVCVNPKKELEEFATSRGWHIVSPENALALVREII